MILSWDIFSAEVDFLDLLDYLGYTQKINNPFYLLYTFREKNIVVINENNKYVFFFSNTPKLKGGAIDLLLFHISNISNSTSECNKVNAIIEKYITKIGGKENLKHTIELQPIKPNFNLFYTLFLNKDSEYLNSLTFNTELSDTIFSKQVIENTLFKNKVIPAANTFLFPVVNQSNHCVGMLASNNDTMVTLPYSDTSGSIWFSNIPQKCNHIFVFNTPNEALSFYLKFKIEDAIYLAINTISYLNTQLLLNIQKTTKVKNITFCFTKNAKGYINDLILFSNLTNIKPEIRNNHIHATFEYSEINMFSKFNKNIQNYNQQFKKEFLKFNSINNQSLLQNNSLIVLNNSTNDNEIIVRFPISIYPLKVFIWSYLKFFVKPKYNMNIEILKPKENSWLDQLNNSNEKENTKEFKIAV